MDDSTLVQRAVEGDRDAFAAIYDQYAPRLQAFLWWVLQDRERATEVLFDTFRIAGSRLHQLPDPSRLRPWLYAIAAREAVDADRGTDVEATTADDVGGEFVDVVRAGAQELSARDRALLDLRFRQRLKGRDLADAIGVRAEAAEGIVQKVADRIEHLLGPTLAIRFSKTNCPELMVIVGTHVGPLDARTRRQAEEHVDRCPTCDNWRRRITVSTLLRAAPTTPPPLELRQRVLDDVQLASHDGRPWPRRRSGFPPPLVSELHDERLRRAVMAVAAAVIVGVVLVGALLLASDDRDGEQVASVGSTTTSTGARPSSTTVTTAPGTSTTVVPGGGGEGTGVGTGAGGGAGGGAGTAGASGGRGIVTQQDDPVTPASPGTEEPPHEHPNPAPGPGTPEPDPPAAPADEEGPSLSGLTISPSTVGCDGTATVSVHASDPSGIASVSAVPGLPGGGRVEMSGGGGTYSATVGPFSSPPLNRDLTSVVVVRAVDSQGNESATSGPITLSCSG